MSLVFRRRDGARVEIAASALEKILRYRQTEAAAPEAGGVLLGRYILDTSDVVIDDITTPAGEDARGRFSFKRSASAHQRAIDEAWNSSMGRIHYLGEWHTHPEPDPMPSSVDVGDWKRRLKADRFDADSLVFVIAGTESIGIWEGRRRSRSIRRLWRKESP